MLKINLPHADPGSRETRQRAYQTPQRPNGPPAPGRPRRVGEPNRGPGLSRGLVVRLASSCAVLSTLPAWNGATLAEQATSLLG